MYNSLFAISLFKVSGVDSISTFAIKPSISSGKDSVAYVAVL